MSTIMFNVDESLKKDFSNFAKKLGTNPSNLMRMFMAHTINTKKVSFEVETVVEFEPLDTSNWSPELVERADKVTNELDKLFVDYDKR
ncbi:MAG: type II toxin-antitoxin system RelB/DinJ family antitoxin [Candidatus Peribacteria bacterium]|nr:type II toxin-antitoxin system RelB/DinJ family antitoxin [Candidatus Peribacteria bacterium]